MMKKLFFTCFAMLAFCCLQAQNSNDVRTIVDMNYDWKFHLGDVPRAHETNFNDRQWRTLQLPHDWAIEGEFSHDLPANTGKLPWKGVGWYRKKMELPAEMVRGKKVLLMFDGVMSHPEVYVNGHLAGTWDYGYNSFYIDITPFVRPGRENVFAVKADTRKMESRWYPGAGIYRKVQMIITDPFHFTIWGNHITTPDVTEQYARIRVVDKVEVPSLIESGTYVVHSIVSPEGNVIMQDSTLITGPALHNKPVEVEHWLTLPSPRLWDIDDPVLYQVKARISRGGKILDQTTTPMGLRYFHFDANHGFWLNGRRVQMKGVNLHHDHGPLGGKFYTRAMHRQLEIMKEMGVNALRTSHNTFSPEVLAMCDTMGILVFNEVFDKWDMTAGIAPDTDFEEYMVRNIGNFMKRDRNHPSVIFWSMGNEMTQVQYNINGGIRQLELVMNIARRFDNTRPITIANDRTDGVQWRHWDHYDLHCWNYGRRYIPAREMDPTQAVIISESASTLSTRGFYELPLPESPTDFSASLQVSSYDLNAPVWAEIADLDFFWQDQDRYVAGEYVWTGFDYLGEPTPYNDEAVRNGLVTPEQTARSSFFGIVDLCGIPKDRYWLYKTHWRPHDTIVHILPHWNWEGKGHDVIPVYVYTTGSCAELFLNGHSMGTRCKEPMETEDVKKRYRLMWDSIPWEPGTLKAVAWRDGQPFAEATMQTAEELSQIKLTPDRTTISADGQDLSYILVEAFDQKGVLCPLENSRFEVTVTGAGVLEGLCNGDPQSMEPFWGTSMELFHGKAMIVVRSLKGEKGPVTVQVKVDGVADQEVEIITKIQQ